MEASAIVDRPDAPAGVEASASPGTPTPQAALLFRAALLAGHGAHAASLASRLAGVLAAGDGRSCLDAGSPLQLTLDLGPSVQPRPTSRHGLGAVAGPGLRAGLRLGAGGLHAAAAAGLIAPGSASRLAQALARMPVAGHASMGTWLFWSPRGASVYVDLRDAEPAAALARLQPLLTPVQRAALQHWRARCGLARPWACRLDADDDGGDDAGDQGRAGNGALRVQLHWLYPRGDDPSTLLQHWRPGAWDEVLGLLGHLLKRPERAGRWVLATPLDDEGPQALHVGNSGWALVPEDEAKHRAIGHLAAALGARADQAQALWSLCRATAAGRGHRMGRACEIRLSGAGQPAPPRARLFISPAA